MPTIFVSENALNSIRRVQAIGRDVRQRIIKSVECSDHGRYDLAAAEVRGIDALLSEAGANAIEAFIYADLDGEDKRLARATQ